MTPETPTGKTSKAPNLNKDVIEKHNNQHTTISPPEPPFSIFFMGAMADLCLVYECYQVNLLKIICITALRVWKFAALIKQQEYGKWSMVSDRGPQDSQLNMGISFGCAWLHYIWVHIWKDKKKHIYIYIYSSWMLCFFLDIHPIILPLKLYYFSSFSVVKHPPICL